MSEMVCTGSKTGVKFMLGSSSEVMRDIDQRHSALLYFLPRNSILRCEAPEKSLVLG
jgi:hypothetical protein